MFDVLKRNATKKISNPKYMFENKQHVDLIITCVHL